MIVEQMTDHLPNILPHHVKQLRASSLTDTTIEAANITSEVDPHKVAALLNWRRPKKNCTPALVFPFVDQSGQRNGYYRVRLDTPRTLSGRVVKYESPIGESNRAYFPPGIARALDDAQAELLMTEGEKKSLCATQHGFACIGISGVWAWKPKRAERLLPELERIEWQGRRVFICYDSDVATKADVQLAESRLAKHLADRGAIVRVVRLPESPDGKVGLDDYLLANGPGELRTLLDAAIEPEPLTGAELKEDARAIDPGTEAKRYLKTLEFDGLPRLRYWHETPWLWEAGAYRKRQPSEVRAEVLRQLDRNYRNLMTGMVSCVIDHVRAWAILSSDLEAGTWLEQQPTGWKPEEILATNKEIIHLPTLVAGNLTDAIRPATPKLFTTAAVNFAFDPQAPRPDTWLTFLGQLWPNDLQSVAALQDWFGYCLVPNTSQQKIFLLVGPKRAGKGIIGRVIRELVGHANVAGTTLASLATNFGLEALLGKSLSIISDARLSTRTDSAIVLERLLSISGEDCLTIDRKHTSHITCKLSTRLMILTNELPRIYDASEALASRFVVLRLWESFYGREDITLFKKLCDELPAILLWAITGWRNLHERGHFLQPESGGELANEMQDLASPVGAFVRECCQVDPIREIRRTDLYAAFTEWAEKKGRKRIEDETTFGRGLRAAVASIGNSRHRNDDGKAERYYKGIGFL